VIPKHIKLHTYILPMKNARKKENTPKEAYVLGSNSAPSTEYLVEKVIL